MTNLLTPKDCASLSINTAELADAVASLDEYKKLVNPARYPGHTVKVSVTVVIEGTGPIEPTLSFPVRPPSENPCSSAPEDNPDVPY